MIIGIDPSKPNSEITACTYKDYLIQATSSRDLEGKMRKIDKGDTNGFYRAQGISLVAQLMQSVVVDYKDKD